MKRWALMVGGAVSAVVEQEDAPAIEGDWMDVSGFAVGPGFKLSGGTWSAPQNSAAREITSRQGKRALLAAGLYDDALAALNSLPEPGKTAALIDWDAPSWKRDDPTLLSMAGLLGLSEVQLDDLFSQAYAL